MISAENKQTLDALLAEYNVLSFYQKWFYPRGLSAALKSYEREGSFASALAVCDAYVNKTWFFHRWLFSSLGYSSVLRVEIIAAFSELGNLTELALAFAEIPASATSLNLRGKELFRRTGAELALAFASIPASVTSLNLGGNELYSKTAAELALAFASIPASVTSLDLSANALVMKTGVELALAFAAIPASVTSLDLCGNALGIKTGVELALAFAEIPASVTSLDLSANDLCNKTGAELALIFTAIPVSVISDSEIKDKLVDYFLSLPPTTQIITAEEQFYSPAEKLLELVFPVNQREAYLSELIHSEPIEPSIEIDEQRLSQLINFFQHQSTPMSHLVCGLLLDGEIRNPFSVLKANRLEDKEASLAAIAHYRKAACDEALKPQVESLLWQKRTITDNSPVQESLRSYKLTLGEDVLKCSFFAKPQEGLDFVDASDALVPSVDVDSILAIYSAPHPG